MRDRIVIVEDAEVLAGGHPQIVGLARMDERVVIAVRDRVLVREAIDVRRVAVAEDVTLAPVLHHDGKHRAAPPYRRLGRCREELLTLNRGASRVVRGARGRASDQAQGDPLHRQIGWDGVASTAT
jgi:hypothetical protein